MIITIYRHTKKKHLALGNLAKLVFVSILSFKNWSYSKLLSFFCVSLIGARKIWRNKRKFRIKNWNLDTDNGWGNGRPPGASMKSPSKSRTLAKRDLEFRSPFSNSRIYKGKINICVFITRFRMQCYVAVMPEGEKVWWGQL